MSQLSSVISTGDTAFRTDVTRLLRSSGVPIGILEEASMERAAPDVVVVDARGDGSALDGVEELRARWPSVSVFTVASRAEPEMILTAMRAGANEFFTWPAEADALPAEAAEGLRAAVRRAAERRQATSNGGSAGATTLAFLGAKGGAGTTTLAVNCAVELARRSRRSSAVVDLNPFLGEVGLFLGVRPRFTVLDALDNLHRLETEFLRELMATHKSGLHILAGSDQVDRPNRQDGSAIEELLQILGRTYDAVVIDAGTMTAAGAEAAVFAADAVCLVANPDVASIRNTQRVIDRMEQIGAGKDRVKILLNRSSDQHVIAIKQIEQAVGHPVHHALPSDYATVSAALNAGVPLTLSSHSELAAEFGRFIQSMAGVRSPRPDAAARRSHFLGLF